MHPLRLLIRSLVLVTVALPALAGVARAASTISIGSSILQPCAPTDVEISLDAGEGGIGFDIDVTFDPAVVTVSGVDFGTATADCSFIEANTEVPGVVDIAIACTETVAGPGPIAVVHFNPIGNSSTALQITSCFVDEVACTTQNGTFSVACPATPTPTSTPTRTSTPTVTPTPQIPCTCPGDANKNGFINFADFGSVQTNFGKPIGPTGAGDGNCNGFVNFADFGSVQTNFGKSCTP